MGAAGVAVAAGHRIGPNPDRVRFVGPSLADPRLHVSAVVVAIHVLGQVAFGFAVSVSQVVVAIVASAGLELLIGWRRERVLRWPASALLTGSGVALVLRVLGTEHGQWLSMQGWYLFAAVSAGSLLSKYAIRYRGRHLFNPSNLGLVVAFVVLGGERVEPLDLWWVPFGPAMALGYGVIMAGGVATGRRLRLLEMAVAAWCSLAFGAAVLAVTGHAITARWSLYPIGGFRFWWVIVTSPEVLIFLFFMITDPRTVPAGRLGRLAFGAGAGVASSVAMAPAATEFGTKVGLLGGLLVASAASPVAGWAWRAVARGRPRSVLARALQRPGRRRPATIAVGLVTALVALGSTAAAIAVAGSWGQPVSPPPVDEVSSGIAADPGQPAMPTPTIDPQVAGLSSDLATESGARELAETLAFNLSVEAEAIEIGDATLLDAVDHGERLDALRSAVADSLGSGVQVVPTYRFDTLHLTIVFPGRAQAGPNAGLEATGSVVESSYRDGQLIAVEERPLRATFAMRAVLPGRWFITDVLPLAD